MFDPSLIDTMIPFSFSLPYFSLNFLLSFPSPCLYFIFCFLLFFPYLNDVVILHEAHPLNLVRLRGTVLAVWVTKISHDSAAVRHGCQVPFGS